MPDIEVNIEIYCGRCRAGLCANATATARRGQPCFQVEPCETCLSNEEDKGFNRGHTEGYEEARKAGVS